MKQATTRGTIAALGATAVIAGGLLGAAATAGATPAPAEHGNVVQPLGTCDNAPNDPNKNPNADTAVKWFEARKGSTKYEHCCQKAAGLSWDRDTKHASAIKFWKSSDGKRHTKGTPPKGAFVFWDISSYGHVGVADGKGGFWSTGVNGKIGHAKSTKHFGNYLGWKAGNSN